MSEPEFLTSDEVAALLRVPAATLAYWRYKGEGPKGIKVGRHVRFYRTDVFEWIDERRRAGR